MTGGVTVRSTTVDSMPTSVGPESIRTSIVPSRSLRTLLASVGGLFPLIFALGATTGTAEARDEIERHLVRRHPETDLPAVFRLQDDRERPGPELVYRCLAFFDIAQPISRIIFTSDMWTVKGLPLNRFFTS